MELAPRGPPAIDSNEIEAHDAKEVLASVGGGLVLASRVFLFALSGYRVGAWSAGSKRGLIAEK